jgi:hypothetical protein
LKRSKNVLIDSIDELNSIQAVISQPHKSSSSHAEKYYDVECFENAERKNRTLKLFGMWNE